MTMDDTETEPRFIAAEIKQSRGPTLVFEGALLAVTEWNARDGEMRIELWQSRGGALIPVTRTTFDSGREIVTAEVVEPKKVDAGFGDGTTLMLDRDRTAMRFAVMDFWDWTDRARSMVRKLGWKLKREVA